jgi:hypothetical protein
MARVIALAVLLLGAVVPAAQARDRDKLPDRWERKHHLNTKKNDAKRDRDRDGLSNLREYRAKTNPRKQDTDRDGLRDGAERRFGFKPRDRDSDDDGVKDGRENAGRITAVSAGSITIKLAAGGRLTAQLACGSDDRSSGEDEPSGDDPAEDEDDPSGDDPDADDPADEDEDEAFAAQDDPAVDEDAAFDRQFDDELGGGDDDCAGLRVGALVHEAIVDRTAAGPVVYAVTLVRR